jgi:hypothetical protein
MLLAPRMCPALRPLLLVAHHRQQLAAVLLRRAHVHQRLAVARVDVLAQYLVAEGANGEVRLLAV